MHTTLLRMAAMSLFLSSALAETQRVYIGTKKSKGIYVADLNTATGKLTKPKLAAEAANAGFITISPDNRFLYSTGVSSFIINQDGTLTKSGSRQTGEANCCHVSTDQTGSMLMAAYYGSGAAASFKILPEGQLSEAVSLHRHEGSGTHPKRQTKPHSHSIYPNPANTHAYAADLGIDKIIIYKINPADGSMQPAGEAAVPGGAMGPRHMKWLGDNLYVLNELDLSVSVFQALEEGQLQFIHTVSMVPEGTDKADLTAAEIRIHPTGKFLYTSLRDLAGKKRDSICILKITGDKLDLAANTHAEVWIPRNFNIDASGKWLIVGGMRSNDIAVFSINPESGLIQFTGEKIPFDGQPICFEFLN